MGAGNYSHTTRAVGLTLTANIYNTDHTNHITNHNFDTLDDYSSNNAEMQTTTDPYSSGAESLATSGAGELARIRYLLKQMHYPRSYLAGLGLSIGTDTEHDIDIAIGHCKEDGETIGGRAQWYIDPEIIILESAITKQIDAAWAVGTDAGGMDTGSVAIDTWYHVFIIKRSDTEVVDALFSTSATSPTMPTNYDTKRRIGSVLTDGSSNIIAFFQNGDTFSWDVPVNDWNSTNPGTSAVTRTCTVPTGVIVFPILAISIEDDTPSTETDVLLTAIEQTDTAASNTLFHIHVNRETSGTSSSASMANNVWTDTSAQIRSRCSASNADIIFRGTTHGWVDRRGRDD